MKFKLKSYYLLKYYRREVKMLNGNNLKLKRILKKIYISTSAKPASFHHRVEQLYCTVVWWGHLHRTFCLVSWWHCFSVLIGFNAIQIKTTGYNQQCNSSCFWHSQSSFIDKYLRARLATRVWVREAAESKGAIQFSPGSAHQLKCCLFTEVWV